MRLIGFSEPDLVDGFKSVVCTRCDWVSAWHAHGVTLMKEIQKHDRDAHPRVDPLSFAFLVVAYK